MKNRENVIAIIFVLFILIMPVATIFKGFVPEDSGLSEIEQEILNGNGTMSGQEGVHVPTEKELYSNQMDNTVFGYIQSAINEFADRIFMKKQFISFNTELTSVLTGGTYIESTQVMVGKDGWLFYKTDIDGHPIWDYMGVNQFTNTELEEAAGNLVMFRDYLRARNIDFVAACIPNKEMIYEEYLPDTIVKVNSISRGEQLAQYICDTTDIKFVYPKNELLEAKKDNQIYFKTDTHWNQLGAFIALQEIFNIQYGEKDSLADVTFIEKKESYPGDLAHIAGLTEKYKLNDSYNLVPESVDEKRHKDQVVLIVGDSFAGFLSSLSKEYYREVYWEYVQDFTIDMLDKYNPDIVVWESVERYCERFIDVTSVL